jgi:hypothetical protein
MTQYALYQRNVYFLKYDLVSWQTDGWMEALAFVFVSVFVLFFPFIKNAS